MLECRDWETVESGNLTREYEAFQTTATPVATSIIAPGATIARVLSAR
jgi:hypothetical protein